MRNFKQLLPIILLSLVLTGCGQKGPLKHPQALSPSVAQAAPR
ncbi:MAG: lipoprotein [Candidatus Thiodiazotropha sp.]